MPTGSRFIVTPGIIVGDIRWITGGAAVPPPRPMTAEEMIAARDIMRKRPKLPLTESKDTFVPPFLISPNNKVTFGLDAEFIIRDKDTNLPVSMIDKIGGTKRHPLKVPYGALQEDGVLAEINIDPARTLFEWERNITTVLKCLENMVKKYNCYVDYNSITAEYPISEMKDHRAWESGCDPDFNCWTDNKNDPKEFESTLRTCGGHIHVGFKGINSFRPDFRNSLARTLDYYVGVPLFFYEPENKRRELYGSPGAFRPKPYGVELRTPSNYWLKSPQMRKYTFFLLCIALEKDFIGNDAFSGSEIYSKSESKNIVSYHKISLEEFNKSLKKFYTKDILVGEVTKLDVILPEIRHV